MSALDLGFSFLLTLALHATVLLGAAWLLERAGALKHPGWAELAWRIALFGALLSAPLAFVSLPGAVSVPDAVSAGPVGRAVTEVERPRPSTLVVASMPVAAAATAEPLPVAADEMAPSPSAPVASLALPDVAAALLIVLWFLGLAFGGYRLLVQVLAVRRLGRLAMQRGEPAGPGLSMLSARLAGELAIAPPTLRLLPQAHSPMVLPGAQVLLPAWSEALPAAQQRAMLAHELSHLQRRDPAWRVAQRLAALPLFFHPLARHARCRLDALAEDACDASAAQLLGSGRPLAECLATCLSHAGARAGQPALAVAMAGDPGAVVRRVKNLLENAPMSIRPLSPGLRRSAIVLAILAAVTLPGVAVSTFASEEFANRVLSDISFGDRQHFSYTSRSDGLRFDLDLRGDVTLNATETDIRRLGKGARLDLTETRDGVKRRISVFGKDGVIQRRYWRDGKETELAGEGRAWLSQALPALMRDSGIHAEARGKRLLAEGGPDALLAEIAKVTSDHAQGRYLAVLYANARLDDAQMARSLEVARGIDGDFELRQALQAALRSQSLAPSHQAQVLVLAAKIGSDFELAELLITLADKVPATGEPRDAWRAALESIGSDFERRRVLEALLTQRDVSPTAVQLALEAAEGIGSDFELRNVLERAARHTRGNPAALAAYVARTGDVSSDFEAREALSALINAGPVDLAVANAVLDAAAGISSDFEASEVLRALAGRMPDDEALMQRYRAMARGLGDYERGQVEKALDRFAVVD